MDASIKIKVDQNELVIEEMRTEANEEQNEKEKNGILVMNSMNK